jgi:hypothetical protein
MQNIVRAMQFLNSPKRVELAQKIPVARAHVNLRVMCRNLGVIFPGPLEVDGKIHRNCGAIDMTERMHQPRLRPSSACSSDKMQNLYWNARHN